MIQRLLLSLIAALAIIGCQRDEASLTTNYADGALEVASPTASSTRADFVDGESAITITWAEGDSFSIYDSTGAHLADYQYESALSDGAARFLCLGGSAAMASGESYTAVFPAVEGTASLEEHRAALQARLASQTQQGASSCAHLGSALRMESQFSYDPEEMIAFEHTLTVLRLTFGLENGAIPSEVEISDGDYGTYALNIEGITAAAASYTVYAVIEPNAGGERMVELDLTDSDGEHYQFTVSTEKTYLAGCFYGANINTFYDLVVEVVGDAAVNDTSRLQLQFDEMSAAGGGNIYFPAGTYHISELMMRSNIHLYIDPAATISPYWPSGTTRCNMLYFSSTLKGNENSYVENCSIQCSEEGERYTVDYSFINQEVIDSSVDKMMIKYSYKGDDAAAEAYVDEWNATYYVGCRFIVARMVRDFYIADVNILDNWTTYCGIIFTPADDGQSIDGWEVTRPTDGVIKNCSIFDARMGYGMCQLHGAETLYFENLYSRGGITLRLESGSGGDYAGVYNITGENIVSEKGLSAVMMNPHLLPNGKATINNVTSIGSSFAVMVRKGFADSSYVEGSSLGTYSSESSISNIHAIYGTYAQVDDKDAYLSPKDYSETEEQCAEHFALSWDCGDRDTFRGPSLMAVYYESVDPDNPDNPDPVKGEYQVQFSNVTSEGFIDHYTNHRDTFTGESNLFMENDTDWDDNQTWKVVNRIYDALGVEKIDYADVVSGS